METKTFPVHRVLIDRERAVIRVDVPEHELRVLQLVHGVQKCKVIEKNYDEVELDPSASAEFDRLTRIYVRTGSPDPVRAAFTMGPDSLQAFGFTDSQPIAAPEESRAHNAKRAAKSQAKAA